MPPRIHVIAGRKGGVGKTTLAVNLAAVTHAVLTNRRSPLHEATGGLDDEQDPTVLLVNTDPQGSSVWWSGRVEGKEGLPYDIAQAEKPAELQALRRTPYQHIFVDTPGSLEDDRILQAVLDDCDDVIVPMEPEPLCFEPTRTTINDVLVPRGLPYRVVINNWDPRDGVVDLKDTADYIKKMRWPVCNTIVRHYKIHTRASAVGQVVTQYPKNRVAAEAREDMFCLALELGFGGSTAVPQQTGIPRDAVEV